MQKSAEREKLGDYYQSRMEYFKRQIPFLDELILEAHLNLVRTGGMLHQAVDQRMRAKNLTAPAFGILCLLESSPDKQLAMNEIGERLVVSQANVTGLVDTLAARGYVQRKGDTDDR